MFDRLAFWKDKGMNPSIIFDIGANKGDWSRQVIQIFPQAQVIAFEANGDHTQALSDLSANIVLLGSSNKENIPFYKNTVGCTTGDSIYLEQTLYYTPQTAVIQMLPLIKLEDYIHIIKAPTPDFIKLDVQGAELDVLRGAVSLLPTLKYCVIETSLHKYNRDAPLIEDIIAFMKTYSFDIIDFVEFHRINGYLAQVDILFAHSSTGLRKEHFYDGMLNFS